MNTNSIIIKGIIAFFAKLGFFYEYSFLCKILSSIYNGGKNSKIIKSVGGEQTKDYGKGSLLISLGLWIFVKIMSFVKWVYDILAKANDSSFNKKLFTGLIISLKLPENCVSAVFCAGTGIFAVLFAANLGSVLGLVFGCFCVVCFFAGFVFPKFSLKAFEGCAPVRLIKWFFE